MKKQAGSTELVVIIILALAVIGLLGFVFWQNFMAKGAEPSDNTQTVGRDDKKKEVTPEATEREQVIPDGYTVYKDETLGFSLAYPKDWGELKAVQARSDVDRVGANGDSTKALAGSNGGVRIAIYTKDSFYAQNHAGYVLRYQADTLMGSDAGSETYSPKDPIPGTSVYAHNLGDAELAAYNLFFKVGNSVVYVHAGDKDTQSQIAKTVKV